MILRILAWYFKYTVLKFSKEILKKNFEETLKRSFKSFKINYRATNTNYFKPILLKFKILIYNSDSKIMYNFCMHRGNTPPQGEGSNPPGGDYFYREYFRKKTPQNMKD